MPRFLNKKQIYDKNDSGLYYEKIILLGHPPLKKGSGKVFFWEEGGLAVCVNCFQDVFFTGLISKYISEQGNVYEKDSS